MVRVVESGIGTSELSSAIAAALDDICRDLERYRARREQHLQLGRCIAAADRLIDELQGLSLAGGSEVPAGWQPRLDGFVAELPAGVADRLRSGSEPYRLLDEVFAIEERLFRLKLGEWARAFEDEPGAEAVLRTPAGGGGGAAAS
jgi:hypothetical protein